MAKFAPGQSGNPGGRPKGSVTLRRYAETQTRSGRELVDFCVEVLKGKATGAHVLKDGEVIEVPPTIKDKAWAAEHLTKVLRVPLDGLEPDEADKDADKKDEATVEKLAKLFELPPPPKEGT